MRFMVITTYESMTGVKFEGLALPVVVMSILHFVPFVTLN
jgi:hypothetical protein